MDAELAAYDPERSSAGRVNTTKERWWTKANLIAKTFIRRFS